MAYLKRFEIDTKNLLKKLQIKENRPSFSGKNSFFGFPTYRQAGLARIATQNVAGGRTKCKTSKKRIFPERVAFLTNSKMGTNQIVLSNSSTSTRYHCNSYYKKFPDNLSMPS